MTTVNYSMGEDHARWTLTLTVHQHRGHYRLVLSDSEDSSTRITTGIVSAATTNYLEDVINKCLQRTSTMENIHDVYATLQREFAGTLFALVGQEGVTA